MQRVKDNMDEDCLFVNIWTAQVLKLFFEFDILNIKVC